MFRNLDASFLEFPWGGLMGGGENSGRLCHLTEFVSFRHKLVTFLTQLPMIRGRPFVTDSEQHWRKLADETRAAAQLLTNPNSKRTLLRIAQHYEALAERARQQEMKAREAFRAFS